MATVKPSLSYSSGLWSPNSGTIPFNAYSNISLSSCTGSTPSGYHLLGGHKYYFYNKEYTDWYPLLYKIPVSHYFGGICPFCA